MEKNFSFAPESYPAWIPFFNLAREFISSKKLDEKKFFRKNENYFLIIYNILQNLHSYAGSKPNKLENHSMSFRNNIDELLIAFGILSIHFNNSSEIKTILKLEERISKRIKKRNKEYIDRLSVNYYKKVFDGICKELLYSEIDLETLFGLIFSILNQNYRGIFEVKLIDLLLDEVGRKLEIPARVILCSEKIENALNDYYIIFTKDSDIPKFLSSTDFVFNNITVFWTAGLFSICSINNTIEKANESSILKIKCEKTDISKKSIFHEFSPFRIIQERCYYNIFKLCLSSQPQI